MTNLLTDDELLALMTEELADHEGPPLELVLRPTSALLLTGLLQLALRHPDTTEHSRQTAVTFITHVRMYFADAPATLEVLRRGDDPAHDIRVRR
jgi:hypothetical protein